MEKKTIKTDESRTKHKQDASRQPTDRETEGAVVPKWPFREKSVRISKTQNEKQKIESIRWNGICAVRPLFSISAYCVSANTSAGGRAFTQPIYRRVCLRSTFLFLVFFFLSDFWFLIADGCNYKRKCPLLRLHEQSIVIPQLRSLSGGCVCDVFVQMGSCWWTMCDTRVDHSIIIE